MFELIRKFFERFFGLNRPQPAPPAAPEVSPPSRGPYAQTDTQIDRAAPDVEFEELAPPAPAAPDDGLVDYADLEDDMASLDANARGVDGMGGDGPLPPELLVARWRAAINEPDKIWAVFAHGTLVALPPHTREEAEAQAVDFLAKHGPVTDDLRSSAAQAVALPDDLGWAVASHHELLTYVAPEEAEGDAEAVAGQGLAKRARDAAELRVVHIENAPFAPQIDFDDI